MSKEDKEVPSETGQSVFDESCDAFNEFLVKRLEDATKKHEANVPNDEKFDRITEPTMAGIFAVFVEYSYHMGYSKSDLMERLFDFFNHSEENDDSDDDDEEHICPDCAKEEAEKEAANQVKKLN